MALTTTTLSGAITSSAQSLVVASATGIVAGSFVQIDQEILRVGKSYVSGTTIPISARGINGTVAAAHATSANVTHGAGSDFANAGAQVAVSYPIAGRARTLTSYSASGAIALPTPGTDAVAVLNGTGTLTMTLANPTKDMDGCLLYIVSNAKVAYTVTYAAGWGGAGGSYDVATGNTSGQTGMQLIACNAAWVLLSVMTGTLTNAVPASS